MSTTESNQIRLEVNFKENGADITCRYAVTAEILRQARIWSAQQTTPATAAQANWFNVNGAQLDSKDGPAYIETRANGTRIEEYWHDGKWDRADGKWDRADGKWDRADGPTSVTVSADGTRIEEYWHDGKRDRADGPARVETLPGGTRIEAYFHADKLDRIDGPAYIETHASGTRIEEYWHDGKCDRADGPAWSRHTPTAPVSKNTSTMATGIALTARPVSRRLPTAPGTKRTTATANSSKRKPLRLSRPFAA